MAKAPYADVFQYIGNFSGYIPGESGPGNIGTITPGSGGGGGGGGEGGGTGDVGGGKEGTGAPTGAGPATLTYGASSPAAQALLDKYGKIASLNGQGTPTYDFSKLPGKGIIQWPGGLGLHAGGYSIDQFMPADPSKMANPNAIIHDPNFGDITPLANAKQTGTDKFAAMLPYIAVSAMTGGVLSAIGAPAAVGAGLSGFRNAAMGGFKGGSILQSLLSMAGSATGLPGGSMIGSLLSLAQGKKGGGGGPSAQPSAVQRGNAPNQQAGGGMTPLLLLLLLSMAGKGKGGGG